MSQFLAGSWQQVAQYAAGVMMQVLQLLNLCVPIPALRCKEGIPSRYTMVSVFVFIFISDCLNPHAQLPRGRA